MNHSDHPQDEDASSLFRQAVGAVKPLKNQAAIIEKPKPAPRAKMHEQDERQVLADLLSDHYDDLDECAEQNYCQHGVDKKVLRNLRKGVYSIQRRLDLHGMNRDEARRELVAFLHHCQAHQQRAVCIIHGRALNQLGQGVLKKLVHSWLRQKSEVLAFCSAPPHAGGQGAVYVLLKKPKPNAGARQ